MKFAWIKKTTALATAIVCIFSLSACGQTSTNTDSKATTSAAATTATTAAAAIDPLAKYDAPVTIKVARELGSDFTYYGGETYDKNSWTDMYLEDLNIKIKTMWCVSSPDEGSTKMTTAIASGDYPDIFVCSSSSYQTFADSGVIADVTTLYDSCLTENVKKYLASDNGLAKDSIKLGGKLYGIPLMNNPYDSANVLWIRSDWLKKLGLNAPTNVAELQAVAQAFTEKDPDGDNKADTYGIAMSGKDVWSWFGGVEPFFEMYGAYPGSSDGNYPLVDDGTGKIVWGGSLSGMKTALEDLHKFYTNGWIAQDFGTMDTTKIISEFGAGKAGMLFAPMYGCMTVQNTLLKTDPNATLIAVPIPGQQSGTSGKVYLQTTLGAVNCISSKCKNPEALFKLFGIGLEKVAYAKDSETYAKFNGDGVKYSGFKLAVMNPLAPFKNYDNYQKVFAAVKDNSSAGLNIEQLQYYNDIKNYYEGKPVSGSDSTYVAAWGEYGVFANPDGGYAAVDKFIKSKSYINTAYPVAQTNNMASNYSTLEDLAKTNIIKIIYGNAEVSTWDSVVEQWNSLGGNTVLTEANDWAKSK